MLKTISKTTRNVLKANIPKSNSLPLIYKGIQKTPQNKKISNHQSLKSSPISSKIIKKETSPKRKIKLPRLSKNQKKLNKLYKIDTKFIKTIQKLKNNNNVVYHDNFNISNYQNDLLRTVSKNIRYSYLRDLSDDFKALNGIKSKKSSFSSQWQILARRLENFAPQHLINKLNNLGRKSNLI